MSDVHQRCQPHLHTSTAAFISADSNEMITSLSDGIDRRRQCFLWHIAADRGRFFQHRKAFNLSLGSS